MSRRTPPPPAVRRRTPTVAPRSGPKRRPGVAVPSSYRARRPAEMGPRRRNVRTTRPAATLTGGDARRRMRFVTFAICGLLIIVVLKIVELQTAGGAPLRAAATDQWTRTATITADRGTIFDRNGEELAVSIPASTISINPKLIDDPSSTLAVLTSVLGLDAGEQERLWGEMIAKERGFVYVRRQVDDALGEQLAELRLSGVNVDAEPRRVLPGGDTGRSVIGLTDIDGIGIAGLEMQFDSMLTGVSGERQREVAPGGRSIPGSEVVISAPVPGDDLILTIDRSIQHACESALTAQVNQIGAKAGQCIVMDTDTGDLLAMATVKREAESGEVRITSGNLAAVDSYEPGSVAKVITVAAGLNEGAVTEDTTFIVPWRREYGEDLLKDSHEHPDEEMSVRRILVESSNIGTIDIQQATGRPTHWDYMRLFGLGSVSALGFPGESAGILHHWTELQGSEQVTVSYGQGVASTGIQLVSAVNVIANDGLYVAPRLVRATVDRGGAIEPTAASATHEVVTPAVAETVQSMMVDVICAGTGSRARVDSFNVAGKTGTGLKAQPNGGYLDENGRYAYYSSFVGFFPAEDPQITVLISIDEPPAGTINRFGGTAAAPVFSRLVPTVAHELGMQPPDTPPTCEQA